MVKQVNMQEFDNLLKGNKPVVCDFFATWCGPCKMLSPVMDRVAQEYADKAEFVKVDVDQNPELARRYGIMSIPLVSVFRGGEEVDKSLGYMDEDEAKEFVANNL